MDNLGHNPGFEMGNNVPNFDEAPMPLPTPEHGMSQMGNMALNMNAESQMGPVESEEVVQAVAPVKMEEKNVTEQPTLEVNKGIIVTDESGLSKKAVEHVAKVVNDLKDDPAALDDAWYDMVEANLKNSYGREIGKVA